MLRHEAQHLITPERLKHPEVAKWRCAWVLTNPRKLSQPVRYEHKSGAVIWVTLDSAANAAVNAQLA